MRHLQKSGYRPPARNLSVPPKVLCLPPEIEAFPQKFMHSPKSPMRSPRNLYIPPKVPYVLPENRRVWGSFRTAPTEILYLLLKRYSVISCSGLSGVTSVEGKFGWPGASG